VFPVDDIAVPSPNFIRSVGTSEMLFLKMVAGQSILHSISPHPMYGHQVARKHGGPLTLHMMRIITVVNYTPN
jgi:hypothetical protein